MFYKVINNQSEVNAYLENAKSAVKNEFDCFGISFVTTNIDIVKRYESNARLHKLSVWNRLPKPCELAKKAWFCSGQVDKTGARIYEITEAFVFEYDGKVMLPTTQSNKPTYGFVLINDDADYINWYNRDYWCKENPAPQKTSCPTEKVLEKWAEYLTAKQTAAKEWFAERSNGVAEFLKKVKSVATETDTITDTRGEIKRGGVIFKYTISGVTISTSVEVCSELRFCSEIDKFINFFK